jgi:hypothetical protein
VAALHPAAPQRPRAFLAVRWAGTFRPGARPWPRFTRPCGAAALRPRTARAISMTPTVLRPGCRAPTATVAERERYWWARRTERLLSNLQSDDRGIFVEPGSLPWPRYAPLNQREESRMRRRDSIPDHVTSTCLLATEGYSNEFSGAHCLNRRTRN